MTRLCSTRKTGSFVTVRASRSLQISLLALLFAFSSSAGCERRRASLETFLQETPPDPFPALRTFEAERRALTNFSTLPPSDQVLGADPYAIAPLGQSDRFVSILRGRDAIVVVDAALKEVQRLPAPRSPSGLAVSSDGKTVFVVGERDPFVARYSVADSPPFLVASGRYDLPEVRTLRDVAVGPEGVLYVVDEDRGRLISLVPKPFENPKADSILPADRKDVLLRGGPIQVRRIGKFVITNCLLAHALVIRPVEEDGTVADTGETRIAHDGPIWGFSALPSGNGPGEGLTVLAGGVEDHPLDRKGGFFGYIDSFVFLYDVQAGAINRLALINTSELGVVTPKAVHLDKASDGHFVAYVTGYGGEKFVRFDLDPAAQKPPDVLVMPAQAGIRALAKNRSGKFVAINPLLDSFAILREDGTKPETVAVEDVPDDVEKRRTMRLGEALFFTTLMAPNNSTQDALSSFTCETCHFEGYVDGRIHHTGRGEVRVVTKPLLGLFNNRPHFSRALDPDLSSVAHNEFRVAGAGNDVSPWFVLDPAKQPTLASFDPPFSEKIEPLELRKALMTFLMAFSPRTNPAIEGRTSFTEIEAEGARVFRDKCESCHQARTSTDALDSRVAFEEWPKYVFSPSGPIVWALNEYRQTGVVPYVHAKGARIPSLRRLYKKRPYLTNGTAFQIRDVLERIGFTERGLFFHDQAPASMKRLEPREIDALQAFLSLL
jgi:hypothetical protein